VSNEEENEKDMCVRRLSDAEWSEGATAVSLCGMDGAKRSLLVSWKEYELVLMLA